jgi:hypothetical protein
MPASPQRDYLLWGISDRNPERTEFLQAIGLLQLVNLTATLLDGLVDPALWPRLSDYTLFMNVYQLYEIVSDNLAIGLARPGSGERRRLLTSFNDVMIARLRGSRASAAQLLESMEPHTRGISCFGQSLVRETHLKFARLYVDSHPGESIEALEYGLWPVLVANIESCVDLANLLDDSFSGSLLREGLVNRYWAVNRTVEVQNAPLLELAAIGAHSILVWPTLGYYVSVLAEVLCPNDHYLSLVEDGTIAEALYTGALLVRLLNDLGTGLLRQNDERRERLLNMLTRTHEKNAQTLNTITLLLLGTVDQDEILTRLHKDLFHGEFNVGLHTVRNMRSVPDAIRVLGDNLTFFSRLYGEQRVRLEYLLATIATRMHDDTVSQLIGRFVFFHEKLYANHYTKASGEYAI